MWFVHCTITWLPTLHCFVLTRSESSKSQRIWKRRTASKYDHTQEDTLVRCVCVWFRSNSVYPFYVLSYVLSNVRSEFYFIFLTLVLVSFASGLLPVLLCPILVNVWHSRTSLVVTIGTTNNATNHHPKSVWFEKITVHHSSANVLSSNLLLLHGDRYLEF